MSFLQNGVLNVDLKNEVFTRVLSELAPVYLRVGGSVGDCIRYEQPGIECIPFSPPTNSTVVGYEDGPGFFFPPSFGLPQ